MLKSHEIQRPFRPDTIEGMFGKIHIEHRYILRNDPVFKPFLLRGFHQLVKNDGYVAVTELVYLLPNPPDPVIQYFEKEYPDIKDIRGKIEVIHHEGFRLLSHFTLPESSWLVSYYLPMEQELSRLKGKYQGNEIALGIFEEMEHEIDFYKKYSDCYGYEFFVMQRVEQTPSPL